MGWGIKDYLGWLPIGLGWLRWVGLRKKLYSLEQGWLNSRIKGHLVKNK